MYFLFMDDVLTLKQQLIQISLTDYLAYRFRIKKAGGFRPDEPPFGVRLPPYGGTEGGRSDEKSGEIWPKSDLF